MTMRDRYRGYSSEDSPGDYGRSPRRKGRSTNRGPYKRRRSGSPSMSRSDRSMSYSESPPRRKSYKKYHTSQRDEYGDDSPSGRRAYSPPIRNSNIELEREVASLHESNRTLETKVALLQEKLNSRSQLSSDLSTGAAELESRLAGAEENLRRATSHLKKLGKAHLKVAQAGEDVKRYQSRLDRLIQEAATEDTALAVQEEPCKSIPGASYSDDDHIPAPQSLEPVKMGTPRETLVVEPVVLVTQPPPPPPKVVKPVVPVTKGYDSDNLGDELPTYGPLPEPDIADKKEQEPAPKPVKRHIRKREERSPSTSEETLAKYRRHKRREGSPRGRSERDGAYRKSSPKGRHQRKVKAKSPSESSSEEEKEQYRRSKKEARNEWKEPAPPQREEPPAVAKLPQKLVLPGADLEVEEKPRKERSPVPPTKAKSAREPATTEKLTSPPADKRTETAEEEEGDDMDMSPPREAVRKKPEEEVAALKEEASVEMKAFDDLPVKEPEAKTGVFEEMQAEDKKDGGTGFSFKFRPPVKTANTAAAPKLEARRRLLHENRKPITIGSNPPIHQALLARAAQAAAKEKATAADENVTATEETLTAAEEKPTEEEKATEAAETVVMNLTAPVLPVQAPSTTEQVLPDSSTAVTLGQEEGQNALVGGGSVLEQGYVNQEQGYVTQEHGYVAQEQAYVAQEQAYEAQGQSYAAQEQAYMAPYQGSSGLLQTATQDYPVEAPVAVPYMEQTTAYEVAVPPPPPSKLPGYAALMAPGADDTSYDPDEPPPPGCGGDEPEGFENGNASHQHGWVQGGQYWGYQGWQ